MNPQSEQHALEQHYTVAELAALWRRDPQTVRIWLRGEPGVVGKMRKTVPASVAARIYAQRTGGAE